MYLFMCDYLPRRKNCRHPNASRHRGTGLLHLLRNVRIIIGAGPARSMSAEKSIAAYIWTNWNDKNSIRHVHIYTYIYNMYICSLWNTPTHVTHVDLHAYTHTSTDIDMYMPACTYLSWTWHCLLRHLSLSSYWSISFYPRARPTTNIYKTKVSPISHAVPVFRS